MYNVIADVAGRYEELLSLVNKMPKNKIILVGDLVDRGPDSKKVVEWAMNNPNVIALKGNHEQMMVDAYYGYYDNHLYNGGKNTLYSYNIQHPSEYPFEHIRWMESLPIFFHKDGLFVSHAPWLYAMELGKYESQHDAIWNREHPEKRDGVFQVFGHNSEMLAYDDYAICIDDCFNKKLTGFVWPTREIVQVDYNV